MDQSEVEVMQVLLEKFLASGDTMARDKFLKFTRKPIPMWHIQMMNDEPRNQFYKKEIDSQVKDKVVLDIGGGCGLLTTYALAAGAKHVYVLEVNPFLQSILSHVFKNDSRVTLLSKHSGQMTGEEFDQGLPQVVLHEIFGSNLISEMVMETFEDLFKRSLVTSDMVFIPQKFTLYGALHHSEEMDELVKFKDPQMRQRFGFMEELISNFQVSRQSIAQESHGQDVSETHELLSVDMNHFQMPKPLELKFQAKTAGSFFRVWFKLTGLNGELITDEALGPNHWQNAYYAYFFSAGEVLVRTHIDDGTLHLS